MTEQDKNVLSEEQLTKLKNWISERWKKDGGTCPICSSNDWSVSKHLVAAPLVSPGGRITIGGGPAYPAAQITCGVCGYIIYFNAVIIGLMPSITKKEEQKKEGGNG